MRLAIAVSTILLAFSALVLAQLSPDEALQKMRDRIAQEKAAAGQEAIDATQPSNLTNGEVAHLNKTIALQEIEISKLTAEVQQLKDKLAFTQLNLRNARAGTDATADAQPEVPAATDAQTNESSPAAGGQPKESPNADANAPNQPDMKAENEKLRQQAAVQAAENEILKQQAATLAAENEKLSQQAAVWAATPPPSAPIQAALKPGRLAGASWLTTNGGASNLMRGLNVAVLTPTIDSRPIVATALAGIPDLQKEIVAENNMVAQDKKDADAGNSGGQFLLKEQEADLLADQARIARIQKLASNPPPTFTVEQAYSFLKDASENEIPNLPSVIAGNIVKSTKTDVDGKYTITDLPPGNYYVYAIFGSSSIGVDWLVPIKIIAGEETDVDLNNDNAATVRNN